MTKDTKIGTPREFSPSDFMRGRRPELFSDSTVVEEPKLGREVFEYHLETLTKRKQEIEFEHFARRLAEKEICPNLLPQTGPTGGGDSKVDSETYPVADAVSLRWYEGIAREADRERWAFAFSAKAKWRSKVESDVKGIKEAGRDYKIVYFITNQSVRDKTRATAEEDLSKKFDIPVRILDRTWIMRAVFEHKRLAIAIETLKIDGYDATEKRIVGPNDAERSAELDELETQIQDPERYAGVEYQLAEDCLQAALIARNLELPRLKVEGRFDRAQRVADKVGHAQQRLRVAYERVWGDFWWYDDFDALNRLYDQVEELASGSVQATDLELLSNLWTVLDTTVARGQLTGEEAKLEVRTLRLRTELERLAADASRPGNAAKARTDLLFMDLQQGRSDADRVEATFRELKEVLSRTEGLIAYPVDKTTTIIREIGDAFTDSPAYDELFEVIVDLTQRRTSEAQAGLVLLERGHQKLRGGKRYEAIRLLGRAQQKLAMREYRGECVSALATCALAYEQAGLLWAARAAMLAAANQALSEYWEHGELLPISVRLVRKLAWLDLQLGRVPHLLAWLETASALARRLNLDDERRAKIREELTAFDSILAILLLQADHWELKWLDYLPPVLESASLDLSRMAILYALGYEGYLRAEGWIPESETEESAAAFFRDLWQHASKRDLPEKPEFMVSKTVTLRSRVIGCLVTIEAPNRADSIALAEMILGSLEAYLATSLEGTHPYRPELRLVLRPSEFMEGAPTNLTRRDEAAEVIEVRHATGIDTASSAYRELLREWLRRLIIEMGTQIALMEDVEAYADRVIIQEAGLGRALNFSETAIAIRNVLGANPKFHLEDWEPSAEVGRFPLKRSIVWNSEFLNSQKKCDRKRLLSGQPGDGLPPDSVVDVEQRKHSDVKAHSLIDIPLWDTAGWKAVAFAESPDEGGPPYIALGFTNDEAAEAIFRGWRTRLGPVDTNEELRVSIVTGVNAYDPFSYRVLVSSDPSIDAEDEWKLFALTGRFCELNPPDSQNLDRFLKQYRHARRYFLIAAHFVSEFTQPRFLPQFSIEKQDVHVVEAWQVGENDLEAIVIHADDKPIIPEGVEDVPVLRTIARKTRKR